MSPPYSSRDGAWDLRAEERPRPRLRGDSQPLERDVVAVLDRHAEVTITSGDVDRRQVDTAEARDLAGAGETNVAPFFEPSIVTWRT